MKFLSSLDRKDRRMMLIVLGLVGVILVVIALLTPNHDAAENTTPYSYRAGQHGAKAAFTLLAQSGYSIERWDEPLSELASHAGPGTVLILAEPFGYENEDSAAVRSILNKGGRVLATGFLGGMLLPRSGARYSKQVSFAACEAQPDGLQALAGTGPIWIVPSVTWAEGDSRIHTDYTCAGQPVVVDYPIGQGNAVWWASSTPLENGSITRGHNLELLLNSIGPAEGHHVYWDESLHGEGHSQWDYTSGPVWPLLSLGALGFALVLIFSLSRRSGPVRDLPQAPRTTPIEFLDALGSLYRSTGAAATAVQIAWERFRTQAALLTGQRNAQVDARQIAEAIERRFGAVAKEMEPDLIAAEEACWDESLKPNHALVLVQALRRHEETLRAASTRAPGRSLQHAPASAGVTLGS